MKVKLFAGEMMIGRGGESNVPLSLMGILSVMYLTCASGVASTNAVWMAAYREKRFVDSTTYAMII